MGSVVPQSGLFSLLPERKPPWIEFTLSTGTQVLVVAIFVWVRLLHPEVLSTPEHDYSVVKLVSTPVPVNHQPQPLLKPIVVARAEPRPDVLHVPAADPEILAKAWHLEKGVGSRLSDAISRLSPENLPKFAPEIEKRQIHLFAGTHVEAVPGECTLPDILTDALSRPENV